MSERHSDIPNELYTLHSKLLEDSWATWRANRSRAAEGGVEAVRYARLSIVTLSQMAAMTAVDIGLTEKQFLATCKANFDEAYKRAPKWS
jgi:hypothetical protein